MSRRLSRWRRRRAAAAAPKPSGAKSSKTQIVAVVIIALIALSGAYYYFAIYNKPSTGYFSERIRIDIGGAFINSTDPRQEPPGDLLSGELHSRQGSAHHPGHHEHRQRHARPGGPQVRHRHRSDAAERHGDALVRRERGRELHVLRALRGLRRRQLRLWSGDDGMVRDSGMISPRAAARGARMS